MKKTRFLVLLKWGILLGVALSLIQFIKAIGQNLEYLSVGPIADLFLVIAIIAALFLGIRECRDQYHAGNITFGKSFFYGAIITFFAFCVVFLYLSFYYTTINKEGLTQLNERTRERYIEKIKQDTIREKEIANFILYVEETLTDQKSKILDATDTAYYATTTRLLDTIYKIYDARLSHNPGDTSFRKLSTFSQNASRVLVELAATVNTNTFPGFDECLTSFNLIIQNTATAIQENDFIEKRYQAEKDIIPQYTNPLAAALYFSLSVIIYGLLFNVFVSLYLYRSRATETNDQNDNIDDSEEIEEREMNNDEK